MKALCVSYVKSEYAEATFIAAQARRVSYVQSSILPITTPRTVSIDRLKVNEVSIKVDMIPKLAVFKCFYLSACVCSRFQINDPGQTLKIMAMLLPVSASESSAACYPV